MCPTSNQLSNGASNANPYPISRSVSGFEGCPHNNGIIYNITTTSPRNPNSANRTIANVNLTSNNQRVFANIPGIGEHNLQNHALVFLSGHGPNDTPGINYHLVSGLCDFHTIELYGRTNSSSNFGVNRLNS